MESSRRVFNCKSSPDHFCYVCGLLTVATDRRPVNDTIRAAYFDYFNIHLNQDRKFVPNFICGSCRIGLHRWTRDEGRLQFGIPMIWREPKNHTDDCYFCATNINGFSMKNRHSIKYANVDSVSKPVCHSKTLPIPIPPIRKQQQDATHTPSSTTNQTTSSSAYSHESGGPKLFSQADLDDFVRDLNLSKIASELCASRLKDRNLLLPGNKYYSFELLSSNIAN